MDCIDVNGTPFSVHMDRAVKLRSLQSRHERLKYDAYPTFYANTIFPNDDVSNARRLGQFDEQLAAAKRMKEEGNSAFRDGRPHDALKKYEMAVSVFRFLENTNQDWKSRGIVDRFITEVEYECKSVDDRRELEQFLVTCYNNMALASCRINNFSLAVEACNRAIAIDGCNDKAFYLRSRARIGPKSSGAHEEKMAWNDLLKALEINSDNREAKRLLHRLGDDMKKQRAKDKTAFGGLFERGALCDPRVLREKNEAGRKRVEQDKLRSRQQDIILGRQLARFYEDRGMSLKYETEAMERRSSSGKDFRSPARMVLDHMGVDLTDPQTVEMLENLKGGSDQKWVENSEEFNRLSRPRSSLELPYILFKILSSIIVAWYIFACCFIVTIFSSVEL